MTITLTTPALLFPAISLLLLAYTNRFLALGARIRELHSQYRDTPDIQLQGQIANLRHRVVLIRNMQILGVSSLFSCVFCMLMLFAGWEILGKLVFALSLVLMMSSLTVSLRELQISVRALHLHLSDFDELTPTSNK